MGDSSCNCWVILLKRFKKKDSEEEGNAAAGPPAPAEDEGKGSDYLTAGFGNMAKFTGWGATEESNMEITEITEIPEDFKIGDEVLQEDECYKITLKIISAKDLIAMDSNGNSDPYVEIVFSKDLALRTKTINKNCNPVWNEKFTLYIDDRSALANLLVFDYDLIGSNDRIGYVDLDLASIPPYHRYTTTIPLGSSVEGEEFVGTLTFSYLVEIVKIDTAHDIKSIGTKGQERLLGVIQLTVIEGIDLPPMNSDGTCDPYISLTLGKQQFQTKVITSTLNPKWREDFEFQLLSTSGHIIQASLWDHDSISDNLIGDTEIDISTIQPNKPFKYIFGLDHTNTKISLLLKVLKFAELGPRELQLQKEMNEAEVASLDESYSLMQTPKDIDDVGYLVVKIIRATNIPNKNIGTVDPFVVIEIENCRSITPIRENCTEPEWNLTYRFPINDYHSVLYLSLWDDEDLVSNVILGKIAIPLFNCKGLKKYILKDKTLSTIGKGELIVETSIFYNPVRAAIRTFTPKEEIIMKEATSFDISLLQRDVKRITAQVEILQDIGEGVDQIIRWRSKTTSLFSMIIFVLVVYYIELWMVPLIVGLLLILSFVSRRMGIKRFESWIQNAANKPYYELHRKVEEGAGSQGIGAKLDKFKALFATAEQIQTGLDLGASIGEKFGHIGQWKNPFITAMCTIAMLVVAVILHFVSIRYLIILWGLNKFRKFYLKPNLVDNNELEDLLSRVPSFPEIEQFRQIKPRVSMKNGGSHDVNHDEIKKRS